MCRSRRPDSCYPGKTGRGFEADGPPKRARGAPGATAVLVVAVVRLELWMVGGKVEVGAMISAVIRRAWRDSAQLKLRFEVCLFLCSSFSSKPTYIGSRNFPTAVPHLFPHTPARPRRLCIYVPPRLVLAASGVPGGDARAVREAPGRLPRRRYVGLIAFAFAIIRVVLLFPSDNSRSEQEGKSTADSRVLFASRVVVPRELPRIGSERGLVTTGLLKPFFVTLCPRATFFLRVSRVFARPFTERTASCSLFAVVAKTVCPIFLVYWWPAV